MDMFVAIKLSRCNIYTCVHVCLSVEKYMKTIYVYTCYMIIVWHHMS